MLTVTVAWLVVPKSRAWTYRQQAHVMSSLTPSKCCCWVSDQRQLCTVVIFHYVFLLIVWNTGRIPERQQTTSEKSWAKADGPYIHPSLLLPTDKTRTAMLWIFALHPALLFFPPIFSLHKNVKGNLKGSLVKQCSSWTYSAEWKRKKYPVLCYWWK